MGTHISRVKSVDLDSWTDEQLASVLRWGNARANKYWEAKLAPGHVPSEAKIENFIRTKYELKRWVMDGPMPDPATLDVEGDDDVPLSVVKEKQNVERRESVRKQSVGQSAAPRVAAPQPVADLIGGDVPPPRAISAGPAAGKVPAKAAAVPPKTTSAKDSLLGLDFLGTQPAAPPRPASTTGTSGAGAQSRPDLKQSILSLYAAAPRPQPAQQLSHGPSDSFGGMQSSGFGHQPQGSMGGLNDAFSSLSFGTASPPPPTSPPKSPQPVDAFASLGGFGSSRPTSQTNNSAFSALSGGSFFDSKPATTHQPKQSVGGSGGFGGFTSPPPQAAAPKAAPASSALDDLFDFSTPATAPAPQHSQPVPQTSNVSSVFNLSQPKPAPSPAPSQPVGVASNLSGADVWGDNAWAAPEQTKKTPEAPKPAATTAVGSDFGWGDFASKSIVPGASGGFSPAPAPKVAADEEFGGWASSTGQPTGGASKPSGFGGDDLFSNVWE